MSPRISVLIANYNTSQFLSISLKALHQLTINPFQILIADNGSSLYERRKLKNLVSNFYNVSVFYRQQTAHGSMGHGEALDFLLRKIDTPYTVILDADATFLLKGWDQLLIEQLSGSTKIIGTPPVPNTKKPMDFPLMYAMLTETNILRELNVSFQPYSTDINKDTGWELRNKFRSGGYGSEQFHVINTRTNKKGPFSRVICAEYFYPDEATLIASHFGRGSFQGGEKYFASIPGLKRLPLIRLLYSRLRYKWESEQWIHICHKIIDSQA